MRHLLLLALLLSSASFLSGQSFAFPKAIERIYAIPAATVEQLSNWEISLDDQTGLGAPYPAGTEKAKLPPGHYLEALLVGEQLTYSYFHTYQYDIEINAADGKFQLRIHDPAGQPRADANVMADGKKVCYVKKHQAYRRRDWRIDDLKIIVGGDTLFYRVGEDIERSRFSNDVRHLRGIEPFRTLQTPYYYGQSIYHVFKDGIGRQYWHWPRNYPLKNTIHRITRPNPITGYVSTSQPKYRPEDTLRISAYLAFPKGRPVGPDSVNMLIQTYGGGASKRYRARVGGNEKGRYLHVMAIPADWPLDQEYTVSFDLPGVRWRDISPTIRFKLQDYELAEYALTTAATDDARLPGSAWLDVKTEDINGLPLPNGEVKITVLLERFVASQDTNTLVLPDTLYTYTEPTDNRKDRRIILPDSLFPRGHSVKIRVQTQLTGPSGEYKEALNAFIVDRRYPLIPKLEVRGDSLQAFLAPAAAPKKAILQTITPQKDTSAQEITLPLTLPIDHSLTTYRLLYGGQSTSESLAALTPVTGNPAYWSRDTLLLRFPNPHAQPLRWTLHAEQRTLATGNQDSTVFIRSGFAPGTTLELHYTYLAGGEWRHERSHLTTPRYDLLTEHKNVLDLQLTQPAKVTPGETVRIALTATDQRGRPASGVRLTAGTFNARFDKTPVTTPTYNRRAKRRRQRQDYQREAFQLKRNDTPPRWLVEDYGLDTALAYRLRYPNAEFTFQRDLDTLLPAGVQHAHFSPFIIRHHKPVTIRTVYVDDRLVYWWHPNIATPYSIPVDSGYHSISLRIDGYVYKKRLYFESCRQLVLSFDAVRWVSAGWTRREIKEPTKEEIDRIYERVFALSHMRTSGALHFQASWRDIIQSTNLVSNSGWAPLGLASDNNLLRFWFPEGDSVDFRFEPRVTYRVSKERDRLYPLKKETVENFQNRSAGGGPRAPGLPQYAYQFPKQKLQPRYISQASQLPRILPMEPVSRLQFNNLPVGLGKVILAPAKTYEFYYADRSAPNRVYPGAYDVLYHFRNDSVFHQLVELGEDSLTLLAFHRADVKHFNNFDRFEGYSLNKPPKAPKPEVVYVERVFAGDRMSGMVTDEDEMPLIGVSILIEGTTVGTVSDFDGRFSLEVPVGDFKLVFSYTGYATQKLAVTDTQFPVSPFKITMESSVEMLQEVVVVGYGSVLKRSLSGSVSTISSEEISNLPRRDIGFLAGRVAGVTISDEGAAINVRGSRSDGVDYYIDGVRVGTPGAATNIRIRGISSLGLSNPLYIVDGVPVENIDDLTEAQIATVNVLKDASATAIYGARGANGVVLIATKGAASGTVGGNLPPAAIRESFSDYAAFVPELQTDRQGKAVFDITFPDDITAWNTFAVGQDRKRRIGFTLAQTNAFLPLQAQLYLPRFLVEGDRAEAATLAINREAEPQNVRLTFSGGKEAARTQDAALVSSIEERHPIETAVGADSMTYQFTVQAMDGKGISDGERRSVPVYPKGTETVSGELLMLTDKTTRLPDAFIRPERGPVTLRLPGNRLQQLLNDLNHIVDYPYACTEQTASRLIGLLQLKAVREAEGKVFGQAGDVPKMILRLEKLRRPDGGFGWWGSSPSSTPWISLHVYRALVMAEKAGQTVTDLTSIRRYLLGRVPELPARDQLQILLALAEEGNPPTDEEMIRIDTFSAPNDYELLAVTRLHQLRGDTVDVQRLLDSSTTHAALGRYWGERGFFFYRQPLDGRLACNLLAQRILSDAGHKQEAAETINYLLGQSAARNRPGNVPLLGTNTLESARLLAELLPALLAEDDALAPPVVTLQSDGVATKVTTFPYETEVASEAVPGLRLQRAGSGPLPVALYQRWFETEPTVKDDGFQITSQLIDARDRPLDQLQRGTTSYLEVTVTSTSDADYVLIEIPIPAGCSYADRNERQGPFAVHREYRRDRVAIFCDRLPAGSYTYKVALAPRFSGVYTLNPARAEMQYLAVVNGNGGLTQVKIGE
ncbi:carboxypeptidase-like regulatory domain-containing protein [Neolewinella persica]|uniref:carboxypeptidase-like regulatory domain-containing protein n=1 Tax=Neolewinella persica TaxID=70998 RepID=UPI0003661329|nr:carboxypeptidase-like regulatory domain-containing protein [Neolewinella persica]